MEGVLEALIPLLHCDDTQESIRFYTELLDFEVVDRMDDVGSSGWAALRRGDVRLMLGSPHSVAEPVKVGGCYPQAVLYFRVRDLEGLRRTLRRRGFEAGDPVVTFYGMRELEVVDPSGHVLLFGEDIGGPAAPRGSA